MTNGGFLDTPDLLKASEKSNRSMVSLHEWTEFSEIARYKVFHNNYLIIYK